MLKSEDKMSDLQDLLDSDDELPTTYNEVPETPAYLNDTRFDAIQFSWLSTGQARKCPKKKTILPIEAVSVSNEDQGSEPSPEICQNSTFYSAQTSTYNEKHTIQYLRSKTHKSENISHHDNYHRSSRTLMKKGILNEQDILCMKTFAELTKDDAALLWFIDFLIYKDLQSDYNFLTSCLVSHQLGHEGSNLPKWDLTKNTQNNYFDLVVI